ncbi:MAG TPA: ribulose-phosphate 3-epimerase [Gemmatimonadales bacterium]|nr:ribulose-phosphate 3-epimerase [Gemmatimonadales bacterium]
MTRPVRIAPSILAADLGRLAEEIARAAEGGADLIHVDVMDGWFVPSLTFGAGVIAAARKATTLPLDVHLMVEGPERYLKPFADAGANMFTLHPEATRHVQRQLNGARELGMRAGLALNPGTPLSYAEEVIDDLDLLLLMTVNPGFGGQRYIPASTDKIRRARVLLDRHDKGVWLEVDGGITTGTIATAHQAGADTFVVGTAVFGTDDPARAVRELRKKTMATV